MEVEIGIGLRPKRKLATSMMVYIVYCLVDRRSLVTLEIRIAIMKMTSGGSTFHTVHCEVTNLSRIVINELNSIYLVRIITSSRV